MSSLKCEHSSPTVSHEKTEIRISLDTEKLAGHV